MVSTLLAQNKIFYPNQMAPFSPEHLELNISVQLVVPEIILILLLNILLS